MLLMWGRQACTGAVVRVTQLGLGADRCRCQVPLKTGLKGATPGLCIGSGHRLSS